jgi:hypothetical protein
MFKLLVLVILAIAFVINAQPPPTGSLPPPTDSNESRGHGRPTPFSRYQLPSKNSGVTPKWLKSWRISHPPPTRIDSNEKTDSDE